MKIEATPIFEETLAVACHNRVDQEYQLIQKALFEEGGDESGTSGSANVLSWQLLQLRDFLGEIPLDQCRVLPCFDTVQGGREDVLGVELMKLTNGWGTVAPQGNTTLPTSIAAHTTGTIGEAAFLVPLNETAFTLVLLASDSTGATSQATIAFQMR